jgi:hypothetical protein
VSGFDRQTIDFLLTANPDAASAKWFFRGFSRIQRTFSPSCPTAIRELEDEVLWRPWSCASA